MLTIVNLSWHTRGSEHPRDHPVAARQGITAAALGKKKTSVGTSEINVKQKLHYGAQFLGLRASPLPQPGCKAALEPCRIYSGLLGPGQGLVQGENL